LRADRHRLLASVYDFAMDSHARRIEINPAVLAGQPVVRGTRLSVEFVVGLLAQGWTEAQVISNFPGLTHDDILACLAYARERLAAERVYPLSA
jgi:uncharacterized protein (DUF433 family)